MILITKEGIIYSNDYNPKCDDYVRKSVDSLIPYLCERIEVEEGLLFGDILKLIEAEKEIMEVVFASHMGHHPLQPYIDDWSKDYEKTEEDMEIEFLRCIWAVDESIYEGETEINIAIHFDGWGKWDDYDDGSGEDKEHFGGISVGFTSFSCLKQLPFKLDTNMRIHPDYSKESAEPILEGKSVFSVYDVIGTILYEMTFYGLPERRDKEFKDLNQTIEDVKSGKAKTVGPFETVEEMMASLMKEDDEETEEEE